MRITILTVAAISLLGAGCATQTETKPAAVEQIATAAVATVDEASATAAIAAAETSRAAAAAVGYEWRDTAQMIADANKAKAEKDYTTAVKLAKQAERQGKDALAQYQQQAKAHSGK